MPCTDDPTTVSGPVGTRLTVPTHISPSGGQSTHPSVVFVPEGLNSFMYWMAHTPFPGGDNDHEDPNIVASNDGINWTVPSGLVNPIDDASGQPEFNSDVDLRLGPDNTLYLFWRFFDPNAVGAEETLFYSTSTNGVTWSAKVAFFISDETVLKLLSPSLLYENNAWTMWAVDVAPSPNRVVRLTGGALPEDTWSAPVTVDVGEIRPGRDPWHLSLIKVGDCYLGLLVDVTLDTSGLNGDLLFIAGTDGLTFANSGATVIPRNQTGEHDALYRATLVPETVGETPGYRVWYSAWLFGPPQVWNIYRTFVAAPQEPPASPAPPPVAQAAIRTRVTWLGCDLVTGGIIHELPDVTGQVSRLIGAYTSANLTIPIPLGGPAHLPLSIVLQAIDPARTMVVAVVNDIPTWAGIPLIDEGGTEATLPDGLVSLEGYLLHRYVLDHTWTQQDQVSVIAAGLLADAQAAINGLGGGIGLLIDAPASGVLRDHEYKASDHTTVYQRLQELMAVQDGPEWTIDVDWADADHLAVAKIARVRSRLGVAAASPQALFQTTAGSVFASQGSSEARYRYMRDRSDGRYANAVLAYSSGEGEDQPTSMFHLDSAALAAGAPIWELHYQPSTSISDVAVLDEHAADKLALLRDGTNTWRITARWDAYPRYGVDWQLGDDIAWDLKGHRHPDGVHGQGRAIGFELDMQAGLIAPILQEEAT